MKYIVILQDNKDVNVIYAVCLDYKPDINDRIQGMKIIKIEKCEIQGTIDEW